MVPLTSVQQSAAVACFCTSVSERPAAAEADVVVAVAAGVVAVVAAPTTPFFVAY